MLQNDEPIETLMSLGLTFLQAKTYLTLAMLGKANVKTIAKASSIARQDIYRVMPKLEKLGLAEKIISNPTVYKATSLKRGLSTLLQYKNRENAELQKKTKKLIANVHEDDLRLAVEKEGAQFVITSERFLFRKRIANDTDAAQTSMNIIYTLEGFKALLFHQLQNITGALERGVRIRIITEKPEKHQAMPRIRKDLQKNPLFEVKFISSPSPVFMAIFDNKEVNIRISDNVVPSLWSNNPHVVQLAVSYFNEMWNKT